MSGLYAKARELNYSNLPKIVTVGLVSGDEVLTGKRRDNNLWTSPGGHLEEGEDILTGARREVLEESGIDIQASQLDLIHAERVVSHRTGNPFILFGFIANIDKTKATAKNDPDKEISEWKWVKAMEGTPELHPDARHAKNDLLLSHLGLPTDMKIKASRLGDDDRDKGRTMKEVSKDITDPKKEPEKAKVPEPKAKTPQEMLEHPDEQVGEREVTGD